MVSIDQWVSCCARATTLTGAVRMYNIFIRMIQKERQHIETIYNTTSTKQNLRLHRGKLPLHCPLDWQVLLFDPCRV